MKHSNPKIKLVKVFKKIKLSGGDSHYILQTLKVYQLKDLISQFIKNTPNIKIKKWKSARKFELVKIITTNEIDLKDYTILKINPKPPKKYPKNVLGKIGKQYNEVQQKEYLVEFTADPRFQNPLEAKHQYLTREGNMEYKKLQEHQLNFIHQFVFSNLRGAIAFHGVGSGKTMTAVVCAYYYLKLYPNNSVIIISPSTLLFNFVGEMIQYGLDPKDNRYKYFTFDKFSRGSATAENSLLIIDEAHNFRTELVMENITNEEGVVIGIQPKTNKKGYNIIQRGGMKAHKVIALTGTAFVNGVYDIENLLSMVDGRNPCEKKMFNHILLHEAQRNDYFNWRLSYYARNSSSEFFPERIDKYVHLVMDAEFLKKYESIEKSGKSPSGYAEEHYGDKDVNDLGAFYNGVLNASNSIDGVDNPKIRYISNLIKKNKNEKFIVYSALMDAGVNILKEALVEANIKAVYITGEQSIIHKENAKKYFNGYDFNNPSFFNKNLIDEKNLKFINSEYRVLIITKAGAEGVDTVNCNNIILLDGQWNNAFTEQIVARAIRFKSHHGLNQDKRFVNVIRPLLIKPSDKIMFDEMVVIDKIKNTQEQNKEWTALKKRIDLQKKKEIEQIARIKIAQIRIDKMEWKRKFIVKYNKLLNENKIKEIQMLIKKGDHLMVRNPDIIARIIPYPEHKIKEEFNDKTVENNLAILDKEIKWTSAHIRSIATGVSIDSIVTGVSDAKIKEYIEKNPNVKKQGYHKPHLSPAEVYKKVVEILTRDVDVMNNDYKNLVKSKTPAIDLYLLILAKSKQAVIDSFIEFFGNKIELFENYRKSVMLQLQTKMKSVNRKLTEEEEADIYEQLLEKEKEQILQIPFHELRVISRDLFTQNQQYFTPEKLAQFVIDQSSLKTNKSLNIRVLEPTAGGGDLIKPVVKFHNNVNIRHLRSWRLRGRMRRLKLRKFHNNVNIDLIEFDKEQLVKLKTIQKVAPNTINILESNNFLKFIPSVRYDYIFTNPPFHLKRTEFSWLYTQDIWDTDFIMRAYGCLAVNGELVGIISNKYKSQPHFMDWLKDKEHNFIARNREKFVSPTDKTITIDVAILKITKKNRFEDNDLLSIKFIVETKKEKETKYELWENEITLDVVDKIAKK